MGWMPRSYTDTELKYGLVINCFFLQKRNYHRRYRRYKVQNVVTNRHYDCDDI